MDAQDYFSYCLCVDGIVKGIHIRTIWLCITNVLTRRYGETLRRKTEMCKGKFRKRNNIKFIIKKNENYINNVGFACVEKCYILMINLF